MPGNGKRNSRYPVRAITRDQLARLIELIREKGYTVIGPTIVDDAVTYAPIQSVHDLPEGWTEEQNGGSYRLKRREDQALFGYAAGPHSWKQILHPSAVRLLHSQGLEPGSMPTCPVRPPKRFAFLGVCACDLQAITILDQIFLHGPYIDPTYLGLRQDTLIVAVNCSTPGGTCFCVSMGTGPQVASGYDLALTEVVSPEAHFFLVQTGSERGEQFVAELAAEPASEQQQEQARDVIAEAARHMGRTLDTRGIKELLYGNYEHPRWDDVADRCLNCANCTMVCPTCFCCTIEDVTDLTGEHAERWRKWDSCFTLGFTHITSGSVRASGMSRYRQWMTHKLATWIDQFGTSGCVGCGRCITWCPVAIDITEETAAIRSTQKGGQADA